MVRSVQPLSGFSGTLNHRGLNFGAAQLLSATPALMI
jgi:hypothetical protein